MTLNNIQCSSLTLKMKSRAPQKLNTPFKKKAAAAAAAAAKSLQLCPTLCDPIDWTMQLTRLRVNKFELLSKNILYDI